MTRHVLHAFHALYALYALHALHASHVLHLLHCTYCICCTYYCCCTYCICCTYCMHCMYCMHSTCCTYCICCVHCMYCTYCMHCMAHQAAIACRRRVGDHSSGSYPGPAAPLPAQPRRRPAMAEASQTGRHRAPARRPCTLLPRLPPLAPPTGDGPAILIFAGRSPIARGAGRPASLSRLQCRAARGAGVLRPRHTMAAQWGP